MDENKISNLFEKILQNSMQKQTEEKNIMCSLFAIFVKKYGKNRAKKLSLSSFN